VHLVQASDPRRFGDRASRVADRLELHRRDDPVLPSRQLSHRCVPNPLSFVAHRATKDRGFRFCPPLMPARTR
jgi:hypothetical protein